MSRKVGSQKKLLEAMKTQIGLTESQKEVRDGIEAAMAELDAMWAGIAADGKKRRLEDEEAATNAINKSKSNTGSTSTTPQEKSQDSIFEPPEEEESKSIETSYERFRGIYDNLSKIYYEMLEIDAELGNDETSRLMEYIKG
jgi:hypothetical protein